MNESNRDEPPDLESIQQASNHNRSIWSCQKTGPYSLREAIWKFADSGNRSGMVSWIESNTPHPRFRVEGPGGGIFAIFHTQGCKCGYCEHPEIDRYDVVRADRCANCGSADASAIEMESSRTMYHWDGEGDEPNRPLPLCRECAVEHHENWDDQWADYNNSRL